MTTRRLKILDLFSGIGGFSLGLHRAGMETVAFCEIEPYPQAVLRKNFPGVPIYDDVRTVTAGRLHADGIDRIDLVCGGPPCQPFSVAGKQRGKADDRHLWPEMFRIIQEVRPTWVIGENVDGFVSMALCEVSADLEGAGYEVQPFVIPACAVNAPHRRDRVWIIAYTAGNIGNTRRPESEGQQWETGTTNGAPDDADTLSQHGNNGGHGTGAICGERSEEANLCRGETLITTGPDWTVESPFCGISDGVPRRVDRLKCLGNAVVPQVVEVIGRAIMAVEAGKTH